MNFPPQTQEDFERLVQEYAGQENTACLYACVKEGGNPSQGIVGDPVATLVLLVLVVRQIAQSTDCDFSDVLGALTEINSMDDIM